ncbi:MAG: S46 family peptidase [Candidatus Cryptobacteroides sp.]|nr:S46 family peptidase [Bacteroidales bacterium]MDY6158147.1 S46 family peptidase [Candidatus Cryptobacteroides sp.]
MKKTIIAAAIALSMAFQLKADEGMWMLPLLEKINSEALANLGSRLTPDQIYSINHSSIKDAIVQFGGGCTGEIISGSGLLVTNHHCGYSNIQALSSEEHNYLEDGFWAMSLEEEIPVPGLSVSFLQSMTDITGSYKNEKERQKLLKKAEKQNPGCQIRIVSFFNDNVEYLVVSKVYRDVRFVGAPPASMGKFGGETDNWMWPRHTCDFSMFRVYAGADNQPAEYSPSNVPFKPAQHLQVSLRGVEEGDFAMIMGYPGRTQRFQTAAQLEEMLEINDIRIDARTVRQEVMWKEMRADELVSLKYASKYASSSNGWKKWQGMRESFAKLDVIGREEEKEAELNAWIAADPARVERYAGAIEGISGIISARREAYKAMTLLSETLSNIELLGMTRAGRRDPYKNYDAEVDLKIALALTDHYLANVAEKDKVEVSREAIEEMFRTSAYTSKERLEAARAEGVDLSNDPAALLAAAISDRSHILREEYSAAGKELSAYSKTFAAALLEWTKDKPSYPDANSTCRLTYGTVKGYEPKDGVVYKYYTTLKGVIEKEEPGNYEFRVPQKVKDLYAESDYGQYADADGKLRTCFLTNLDITGGNSGSPVLDADGCLVGLAFDGNWEAMSSDVIFEPELQRCICVDIRYVLWMMDKFGGAGYLLDEMDIVR